MNGGRYTLSARFTDRSAVVRRRCFTSFVVIVSVSFGFLFAWWFFVDFDVNVTTDPAELARLNAWEPPALSELVDPSTIRLRLPKIRGPYAYEKLVHLLHREKMEFGAILGVHYGEFVATFFRVYKPQACQKLYLVDSWAHIDAYVDPLNDLDPQEQEKMLRSTMKIVSGKGCVKILRMTPDEAAPGIPDGSLDFVYVDARHDYGGVMADLIKWFPKVRVGGIMLGNAYGDTYRWRESLSSTWNWAIMPDGTVQKSGKAVKGAVDDFASYYDFQVFVADYCWYFRKWKDLPDLSPSVFVEDLTGVPNSEESVLRAYSTVSDPRIPGVRTEYTSEYVQRKLSELPSRNNGLEVVVDDDDE